ncbi:MAG TPA: hypothetical protein VL754_04235 [Verrucomicrobiae bacterium]|jgi:hypothetical protein|nr:hypothetical protein [Verrucomicrobiae bacterium]
MKRLILLAALFASLALAAEGKYSQPRFPSYLTAPKSIDEIMPFARAVARQTTGLQGEGLGSLKSGESVALVTEASSEDMVVEAIRRAMEERGVKLHVLPSYELAGVSRADALEAIKARRQTTAEQGYMEARRWMEEMFPDPEVPKKWLKERRPDLYEQLYPPRAEISEKARATLKKLERENVAKGIKEYVEKNPSVKGVFWGTGGTTTLRRYMRPHEDKFLGVNVFDNRWTMMSKISAFPGDVWRLTEERAIEPIAWADRLEVADPEGTNLSADLTEDMASRWARGVYQQGHLYMFPNQATGRFPYSVVEYPAFQKKWNPRSPTPRVSGVIAGTANHAGHYPRVEVHLKDGYIDDVKGGGVYGDLWREFLKYPKINEVTYPYHDRPGYWQLYEVALGTNPKYYKRPDENMRGDNVTERNRSGVLHYGHGIRVHHSPDSAEWAKEWVDFTTKNNLPNDHWWHVHNYFSTYRLRVRGTKNTWVNIIDKGRMTSLDSPEARALASRYGDPKDLLSEDWVPHIPGVSAPGRYEDFAKDPWKTVSTVFKKVEEGTYEYFYPKKGGR